MDEREQVVLRAMGLELEKIAVGVTPSVLKGVRNFEASAGQAAPDLIEKMKPGTGSFFEALRTRARLGLESMKTRGHGAAEMDAASAAARQDLANASTLAGKQEAVDRLSSINAEWQEDAKTRAPKAKGFFEGMKMPNPGISLGGPVAWGLTGLGAGALGAGYAVNQLSQPQQPQGY